MRLANASILMMLMLMLVAGSVAQTPPPVNARASSDAAGVATVEWMPPFSADYMDDFEDGEAQGWEYDSPGTWEVEEGNLQASFFGGGWASAYYGAEMVSEGVFEISVARELGNATRAASLVLFNEDFYPDSLANGFIFNVTPGNQGDLQGSYSIHRFMNNESFVIDGKGYSPAINNGLGAYNTLTIAYEETSVTFYINGYEVFTYYENMGPLSGYFGIAATEQGGSFPDYAVVNWEYAAYDNAGMLLRDAPADSREMPDLNRLLPADELFALHQNLPVDAVWTQPVAAGVNGFFDEGTGSREIDEFQNYRVYRNGDMVGTSETETFTEALPGFGKYEYLVTAYYDEGESVADSASTIYMDPAGIVIVEDFNDGLPANWIVDATVPDHTWHLDDGSELGLFDTPYMLCNDEASMGADLDERLISPAFNVLEAELVIADFDTWFFDNDFEFGHIQYQADGGEWTSVYLYHRNQADTLHAQWDLTEEFAGAETGRIGFLYDDFMGFDGLYWGIDNVQVYVQGAGAADPITLSLMPQNTTIPAGGGALMYDAHLVSMVPNTYTGVRYWVMVTTPNGDEVGPLLMMPFTLQPFMDIMVNDLSLNVPSGAPSGEYTFTGLVGYMNGPSFNDSFLFTKEGAVAGPRMWSNSGHWIVDESNEVAAELPSEFRLYHAYPNPFNQTTKLNVALPDAAELTVEVFDITGRLITTLASGEYTAGTHTLAFDASDLASGLYFVRAAVPGQWHMTRKVTLLK